MAEDCSRLSLGSLLPVTPYNIFKLFTPCYFMNFIKTLKEELQNETDLYEATGSIWLT